MRQKRVVEAVLAPTIFSLTHLLACSSLVRMAETEDEREEREEEERADLRAEHQAPI